MPYKSRAQAAYFNIHKKELSKQGVDVNEWNEASRGLRLPKKLKSYHDGGVVTESGPAILEKGETVVPRGDRMDSGNLKELMASKLGSGKKPSKKARLHMAIHQMDDGKFHTEHRYQGGQEPQPESSEHAPADMAALLAHVKAHFGGEDEGGDAPAPEPQAS